MNQRTICLSVALLIILATALFSHAQMMSSQALVRAEQFTALVDANQWQQAYTETSDLHHLLLTEEQWIAEQQRARALLGDVLNRELQTVTARDHYPGLPDGAYLIISYKTETRYKQKAIEVLLMLQRGSTWDICKYSIR